MKGNKIMIEMDEATLRDYFASAAMQGFCANPESERTMLDTLAEMAYAAADAMLKERENGAHRSDAPYQPEAQ
jgi:hypothetical protein